MIKKETFENLFSKYKPVINGINEHYDNCGYNDLNIPVNLCPCDCYIEQVFQAGMQAEKNLFYGLD